MSSWYSRMSKDVREAAKATAGNWRKFDSFAWSTRRELDKPEQYAIIYLSNRDSDCLDQSNEYVIHKNLKSFIGWHKDGAEYWSESHNHWAVGHVNGIVIRCVNDAGEPTKAFTALHELAMRLQGYPVLDENDLTEREMQAADEMWKNCYNDAERIAYIRRFRSQFYFHTFSEMLSCVRGKFFGGYASELLS